MAVTLIVVDIDLREIGKNIIRRCRGIVEGADRVFLITCLSKALSNMVVSGKISLILALFENEILIIL
jgi:hypothetical protein